MKLSVMSSLLKNSSSSTADGHGGRSGRNPIVTRWPRERRPQAIGATRSSIRYRPPK